MNRIRLIADKIPGSWLICISAVMMSTVGGVTKSFEMDPFLLVAIRALIAGLLLSPFLKLHQIVWNKWVFMVILSQVGLSCALLTAVHLTVASNVSALIYTAPLWILIWEIVVIKSWPTQCYWPYLLLLLGIMAFLCEPNSGSNIAGNLLGVLCGIFMAIWTVSMKYAQGGGALSLNSLMNLCGGALVFIILLVWPGYQFEILPEYWPYITFLAVFQLAGGLVVFNLGLKKVSAKKATTLCVLDFVLAPVWAFFLVGELPSNYGVVGWLIMIVAVIWEANSKDDDVLT